LTWKRRTGSKLTRKGGGIWRNKKKRREPVVLSLPFFIRTQLLAPKEEFFGLKGWKCPNLTS
jgi:hypothetical protein